jgi:Doubled CXXCH motif (Paired_CXXCH_1)
MIPSKKINDVAVTVSGPATCLACHDKDNSWFGSGYPSTSAPTRDATGYPVSGTWPGPATYTSTTNAHRLIPETTQTISAGTDVKRQEGDCLYCHAAHRGANAYDGLLTTYTVPVQSTLASDKADGSYAALCFTCHGGTTPSGFAATPVDIKRFATASGGYGGHSVVTAGGTMPVGAPLPCFECHNPHGSKRDNASQISDERGGSLETSTAAGVRQFCFTCHSTNDTVAGWDSASGYVPVTSSDKIVGLPRDGALLRLPSGVGHNEIDTDSCYVCHGNSYAANGNNVHNPSADGSLTIASVDTSGTLLTSDTVPPVTTAGLAAAYSGTVSLVATDTGSGVEATFYSLDGGVLTTGTVVTAAGDGTHTVQFWSVDNASNVESPTIVAFLVDKTAPVTVSDAVATYVDTATITLTAQDATGGTGIADTYYRLDAGDVATGTVITTSIVGTHTLDFWSVDVAGNTENTHTVTFTISASQAMSGSAPLALLGGQPPLPGLGVTPATDVACREGPGWPDGFAGTFAPPGTTG